MSDSRLDGPRRAVSVNPRANLTVSSDLLMLIGFIWAVLGWFLGQMWWEIGGVLLIMMGLMSLPTWDKGREAMEGEVAGPDDPPSP